MIQQAIPTTPVETGTPIRMPTPMQTGTSTLMRTLTPIWMPTQTRTRMPTQTRTRMQTLMQTRMQTLMQTRMLTPMLTLMRILTQIPVDEFISQQVQGALNANIPHIFLVMIGTNDITWKGSAGVSDELASLIDILTERAPDALVVVAKLIPISYNPAELVTYNNDIPGIVAERAAQGKHVVLVDLNTGYPDNALSDQVHPNDTGYQFMADKWYEAIEGFLR